MGSSEVSNICSSSVRSETFSSVEEVETHGMIWVVMELGVSGRGEVSPLEELFPAVITGIWTVE